MERLAEHEAFLRAIFDAPHDDTPRLAYADFLDEHGNPDRAEFIRIQVELARAGGTEDDERLGGLRERERELAVAVGRTQGTDDPGPMFYSRGFSQGRGALVVPAELNAPGELRRTIVAERPEWFGAPKVAVLPRSVLRADHLEPLFALPAFAHVTDWDFGGYVEEMAAGPPTEDTGTYGLIDLEHHPVITVEGVEALARLRAARRVTALDLSDNNLDNDAARALLLSPYLVNLKRLSLLTGNRLRGKTWQQLLERFGEEVVH